MSEFDYYQVLQLNRTATINDIQKAFRRLSLKYHPTKNPSDITVCSDQFHQIWEAYEVLSDFKKRTVYDKFGAEILSRGLDGFTEADSGFGDLAYKYKRNAFEIFEKFYHEYLPYHEIFDDTGKHLHGSCFGYAHGGILNKEKHAFIPQDVHVDLQCSLEELYNGCMKEIRYSRFINNLDNQILPSDEVKTIEIKPGYQDGHEIVLKREGSQGYDGVFKNLIVHIKQIKHPKYTRKGNDLLYKHDISLIDALNATSCRFETLDGRVLSISVDEIISPQSVRIVENEGMPVYSTEEEIASVTCQSRGNLFIVFDIKFPKNLTEEKKQRIRSTLGVADQK